ncbi:hypothetical protein Sjap_013789 [Stephania japonica]|uniref:Uncharacterized protein n=1 Tax=Stephania japonica TaxID=461633 RepID=A0AAP0J0K6_9MAGN
MFVLPLSVMYVQQLLSSQWMVHLHRRFSSEPSDVDVEIQVQAPMEDQEELPNVRIPIRLTKKKKNPGLIPFEVCSQKMRKVFSRDLIPEGYYRPLPAHQRESFWNEWKDPRINAQIRAAYDRKANVKYTTLLHSMLKEAEAKLGRPVGVNELYLHAHTRKHNEKTFIDARSVAIYAEYESNYEELTLANLENPVDKNDLFYQVVGVNGLGSHGDSSYGILGTSTSIEPEVRQEEFEELRANFDEIFRTQQRAFADQQAMYERQIAQLQRMLMQSLHLCKHVRDNTSTNSSPLHRHT